MSKGAFDVPHAAVDCIHRGLDDRLVRIVAQERAAQDPDDEEDKR